MGNFEPSLLKKQIKMKIFCKIFFLIFKILKKLPNPSDTLSPSICGNWVYQAAVNVSKSTRAKQIT